MELQPLSCNCHPCRIWDMARQRLESSPNVSRIALLPELLPSPDNKEEAESIRSALSMLYSCEDSLLRLAQKTCELGRGEDCTRRISPTDTDNRDLESMSQFAQWLVQEDPHTEKIDVGNRADIAVEECIRNGGWGSLEQVALTAVQSAARVKRLFDEAVNRLSEMKGADITLIVFGERLKKSIDYQAAELSQARNSSLGDAVSFRWKSASKMEVEMHEDRFRSVFLVTGRNRVAEDRLKDLLECWDVKVITFPDVKPYAGKGSPTTLEVLEYVFKSNLVQSVLVLLTPDEESRLVVKDTPEPDRKRRRISRPNVYVELGMALMKFGRERTVVIRLGNSEVPSDFPAHYQQLDNSFELKSALRAILQTMGVRLSDRSHKNWTSIDIESALS